MVGVLLLPFNSQIYQEITFLHRMLYSWKIWYNSLEGVSHKLKQVFWPLYLLFFLPLRHWSTNLDKFWNYNQIWWQLKTFQLPDVMSGVIFLILLKLGLTVFLLSVLKSGEIEGDAFSIVWKTLFQYFFLHYMHKTDFTIMFCFRFFYCCYSSRFILGCFNSKQSFSFKPLFLKAFRQSWTGFWVVLLISDVVGLIEH